MEKVTGSRIATPLAPPSPGSTPMMVPRRMPRTARPRLNGCERNLKTQQQFSSPSSVSHQASTAPWAWGRGTTISNTTKVSHRGTARSKQEHHRDPAVPSRTSACRSP